jgi:hypothetical protein
MRTLKYILIVIQFALSGYVFARPALEALLVAHTMSELGIEWNGKSHLSKSDIDRMTKAREIYQMRLVRKSPNIRKINGKRYVVFVVDDP